MTSNAEDPDDQDEDGGESSGPKQKKFSFLPTFGVFSAPLASRRGLLAKLTCSRYNAHYLL